jgi:WD40 repeat protein
MPRLEMTIGPFARRFLHYTDPHFVLGKQFMCALGYLLALVLLLLFGSAASAQEPSKGFLGIELKDITKEEAEVLGWETPRGIKVVKPTDAGPAANAGILPGDVILSIDGVEVENVQRFVATVGDRGAGAQVRLRVLRSGKEHTLSVTLGQRPPELAQPAAVDMDLPLLMLDTGGHMALIRGLAFTPDGKQLISASDDKVIRVWDWRAGKTITTIRGQVGPGPDGTIYAMALSPDGRWLAAGGWIKVPGEQGHVIRLYDFATGKLAALLNGHTAVVDSLAFSPDGHRLISGSGLGDFSAIIWDVEGRKLLHRLRGHTAHINGVAFTPDGQRVVTGSDDTTLRLWRVSDGGLLAELKGHTKDIDRALAVRTADSMIASGDATGEIRLWDGRTGKFLRTLANQGGAVGQLRFSPDGTRLLSTCSDRGCNHTQHVWKVATGKSMVADKRDNIVIAAAISPDGKLAATGGGNNNVIHVWELATGAPVTSPDGKPLMLASTGASTFAVGFSADSQRVAFGTSPRYSDQNNRGP